MQEGCCAYRERKRGVGCHSSEVPYVGVAVDLAVCRCRWLIGLMY